MARTILQGGETSNSTVKLNTWASTIIRSNTVLYYSFPRTTVHNLAIFPRFRSAVEGTPTADKVLKRTLERSEEEDYGIQDVLVNLRSRELLSAELEAVKSRRRKAAAAKKGENRRRKRRRRQSKFTIRKSRISTAKKGWRPKGRKASNRQRPLAKRRRRLRGDPHKKRHPEVSLQAVMMGQTTAEVNRVGATTPAAAATTVTEQAPVLEVSVRNVITINGGKRKIPQQKEEDAVQGIWYLSYLCLNNTLLSRTFLRIWHCSSHGRGGPDKSDQEPRTRHHRFRKEEEKAQTEVQVQGIGFCKHVMECFE